jgi:hypothetical protein
MAGLNRSFPYQKINSRHLFWLLLIIGLIYLGHYSYEEKIHRQTQHNLLNRISEFMKSDSNRISVKDILNISWNKVCYGDNPHINYLQFYNGENYIATFLLDSEASKLIKTPTSVTSCAFSNAVLMKDGNNFYLGE